MASTGHISEGALRAAREIREQDRFWWGERAGHTVHDLAAMIEEHCGAEALADALRELIRAVEGSGDAGSALAAARAAVAEWEA